MDSVDGSTDCWYCLDRVRHYIAPGVLRLAPRTRVLALALELGSIDYDPACWNCFGPIALTIVCVAAVAARARACVCVCVCVRVCAWLYVW